MVSASKVEGRDFYSMTYEGSTGEGAIEATMTNPATNDVSTYVGVDDGEFTVSVAAGYTGECDVVVSKDGEELDTGHIVFGQEDAEHPPAEPPEVWKPVFPTNPIVLPEPPIHIWAPEFPTNPIVLPPAGWEPDLKPEHPIFIPIVPTDPDLKPSHPIYIPVPPDFWTGNLPPGPEHAEPVKD